MTEKETKLKEVKRVAFAGVDFETPARPKKKASEKKASKNKVVALEDMKQKELRAKAKEVGVKATGSNTKLIERIKVALKKGKGKASNKK